MLLAPCPLDGARSSTVLPRDANLRPINAPASIFHPPRSHTS
jgi:hypothetical protein